MLYSGSVAENISFYLENTTQEDIERAAKHANAHDFITMLPNGYNTQIGEKGIRISLRN